MLGKIALILTLLMTVASAETVIAGNHSVMFNISKPHIVDTGPVVSEIKTFDGKVNIDFSRYKGASAPDNVVGLVKNNTGIFTVHDSSQPSYEIIFYNYTVYSTMPLEDTLDFLKTLKVEPIKPKAA